MRSGSSLVILCLGACTVSLGPFSQARAQSDLSEVMRRLGALETENAALRKRVDQLESAQRKQDVKEVPLHEPREDASARPVDEQARAGTAPPAWQGFHIAIALGGDYGGAKINAQQIDQSFIPANSPPDYLNQTNISTIGKNHGNYSAFSSLALGYDEIAFNRFVYGLSIDADWGRSDLKSSGSRTYIFSDASGPLYSARETFTLDPSYDLMVSLTAHGGVLITQNTLAYGVAGLSFANVEVPQFSYNDRLEDFTGPAQGFTDTGWTIGAGLKHAITRRWHLLAEYRHTFFEPKSLYGVTQYTDDLGLHGLTAISSRYKFDLDTLRLGVEYEFPTD